MNAAHEQTQAKRFLSKATISECMTYRDAVHLAWANRTRQNMSQVVFAELIGAHPSHVSRWLDKQQFDKHGQKRPDLPAELITAAEDALGNHAIQQFLNRRSRLRLLQEVIAEADE